MVSVFKQNQSFAVSVYVWKVYLNFEQMFLIYGLYMCIYMLWLYM